MDENKVTGEHASEERHHHHHHHHHSGRKKRSRRHGFYTVSNSILLVWIVVLTIALMVLVATIPTANRMTENKIAPRIPVNTVLSALHTQGLHSVLRDNAVVTSSTPR